MVNFCRAVYLTGQSDPIAVRTQSVYERCRTGVVAPRTSRPTAKYELEFGSGTGTRTLNLAFNRSARPVQFWRLEFAECRRVPPNLTVCHPRCCMPAVMLGGDHR